MTLEYSLDGGTWRTYDRAIAVNGDGIHVLRYRNRINDITGVEQDLQTKIDTVPPSIANPTITAPIDANGIIRDRATISTPWTDATSGVRWVRHKCGTDPFTESAGGNASWTLEGAGVTNCDSYARDIAGWEAPTWNSGPLIFNRFTMDAEGKLEVNAATGTSISGMLRAGTFKATYNTGTNLAQPLWLTSPGFVTMSGNTNSTFPTVAAPVPVPRLNYPFSYYRDRSVHIQGPLVIDNVNTPLPPVCLYVEGDITIRAVKLSSKVCLIATGNIIDQSTASTFVSGDPANGMLMMAGGNATIGSTGNTNTGLMFAPNGTVTFDGSTGLISKGSAVAKDITLTGVTNSQFSFEPGFAAATYPLPLAPTYIAPPPPPSTPATPAQTFPASGATLTGSSYCIIWTGSSQAYRYEVNRTATFEPSGRVASGDVLDSQFCSSNAPSSTTLYWRAKALGAGSSESGWSETRSFTLGSAVSRLAVNDISVIEGNSGSKVANFLVTRSGASTGVASVAYQTANGSATAGSDYIGLAPTSLTFAAGETSKNVPVTILGDTTVEPGEVFYLNLVNPVGATIDDGSGAATITNDDTAPATPSLAINDITVVEGNSGTRTASFTVTRSGSVTGSVSVTFQTMNGSAVAGSDYVSRPPTTLNFGPGETTKTVPVTITGDTQVEPNEYFYVMLTSYTGVSISKSLGTATITNDD